MESELWAAHTVAGAEQTAVEKKTVTLSRTILRIDSLANK